MEAFDPFRIKRLLDGDLGYRWSLAFDYNEVRANGALASVASSDVKMAIECLLIGYEEPARKLLKKARRWLTVAIDGERDGSYQAAARLPAAMPYYGLAMCNWLLDGKQDHESSRLAVEVQEREYERDKTQRGRLTVSLTLATYVDAGAYQTALDRFAATAGLTPPKSLSAIRGEAQMCYAICRQRLGQQYTDAEIMAAADKFLRRPGLNTGIATWLRNGHYTTAVRWIKIIHWREGDAGISPRQVVRKCYGYLKEKK